MKILFLSLLSIIGSAAFSQNRVIDVQHYRFELTLTDASDELKGRSLITVKFLQPTSDISFNLQNAGTDGKGMTGAVARENNAALNATHSDNRISIRLGAPAKKDEVRTFEIQYKGIPKDGLIISKNKFGQRTFFGDNWPDRAKNWLPCVDDPADKASVEFLVTAPVKYQVVSNGIQVEETNLPDNQKLTHWKETRELPTKIMVIGVAEFAVQYVGDTMNVPIYSYVYTKDRDMAFYDYAQAKDVLPYFVSNIAPFPYPKLANVQSTTIFGGMENAGCIFYAESIITGKRNDEDLLAHEIAHQWFGNMVTETSFAHLWLSEGFATYLTDLYMGSKYGVDTMNKRLRDERVQVLNFNKRGAKPVVDTATKNFMQMLNANSYQKGAWVLHMLRLELGDSVFMNGIRTFYKTYTGKNATTDDFRKIMEGVSGKNLEPFFKQWLYTAGHPVVKVVTAYDAAAKTMKLTVTQQQENLFSFPLEVQVQTAAGNVLQTLKVDKKEQEFYIAGVASQGKLILDPNVKTLFEPVSETK